MTDKPERTWIDWPNPSSAGLAFSWQARPPARRTEYVRADLVDALAARIEKLEKALKPFSDAVYNDNGDVTIERSHIRIEHYLAARQALET